MTDETPAAFAARSNYYNAVSVRVVNRAYKKFVAACEKTASIRSSEVTLKGTEARITFFPRANHRGEKVAQDVRLLAARQNLVLRSLVVEGGRLEDVFYNMTQPNEGQEI